MSLGQWLPGAAVLSFCKHEDNGVLLPPYPTPLTTMQVGDKVRFLHQAGEGTVVAILKDGRVEVATSDDFNIPFRPSELVPIAREERTVFGNKPVESAAQRVAKIATASAPKAEFGLYMALIPKPGGNLELAVVNNTDYDLPFTVGLLRQEQYTGLDAQVLAARTVRHYTSYALSDLHKWPVFVFQFLLHRPGTSTFRPALEKRIGLDMEDLAMPKQRLPLLATEAYLFQLDAHLQAKPDSEKLEQALAKQVAQNQAKTPVAKATASITSKEPPKVLTTVADVVDLHIEKLVSSTQGMNADQIFNAQMAAFESALSRALAARMPKITFIHGVGAGVLKKRIHLALKHHKQVKDYREAPESKFGRGATEVMLG